MTTTDQPTPNVDLLRQTMDAVLAHPELHDQSWWAQGTECGTAHCFAGWACRLNGLTVDVPDGDIDMWTSDHRTIGSVARELLGIDGQSAAHLFDGDNTTADLKHYVDQIAEHGRIVEPVQR